MPIDTREPYDRWTLAPNSPQPEQAAPRPGYPRRRRYPSDLSDQQWDAVQALLPAESPRGRSRALCLRDVADAVNYRWRSGCPWRMLPHDFPPWQTVYAHFRRWRSLGLLSAVRAAVLHRQLSSRAENATTHQRRRAAPASTQRASPPPSPAG